jgi:hypothetical protein
MPLKYNSIRFQKTKRVSIRDVVTHVVPLLFLGCIFTPLQAQNELFVKGRVLDSLLSAPLPGANVTLIFLADSSNTGAVTDADGNFSVKVKQPGNYRLKISFLGYKTLKRKLKLGETGLDLGILRLSGQDKTLNPVQVEGQVTQAVQQGDTTSYNAAAFKTNPDAQAEDLVNKMPGITTENGKVQAQGEDVKQILVDGKPFFGNDIQAALKNLPADIIEKVQVFDQLSDQARFSGVDDGNTQKTINIVTKQDTRDGLFGKVYAGYGYKNRFDAGGNLNYFNGDRRVTVITQINNINKQNFSAEDLTGIMASSSGGSSGGGRRQGGGGGNSGRGGSMGNDGSDFLVNARNGITDTRAAGINYSDKWGKKIKVTGSYFFNWGNTDARQDMLRNFLQSADSGNVYRENSDNGTLNMNHRFNFRMEYEVDSFNVLVINPRLSAQINTGSSRFSGETRNGSLLRNDTRSDFESDLWSLNFSNEITYRHRFKKAGRTISLTASNGYARNAGNNNLFSQNRFFGDTLFADSLDQQGNLFGDGYNVGGRLVFNESLGKGHSINANYSANFRRSYADRSTFRYNPTDSNYTRLDSLLSNTFSSDYHTQSAGFGYRFNDKKTIFSVNASYQWAMLYNRDFIRQPGLFSRQFHSILPSLFFRYKFTEQKNITIRYRASNNIPSVDRFQEVVNNANPILLTTGNPDLKQDFSHFLSVRYNATNTVKSHVFFAMLNAQTVFNYVANSTVIASSDTLVYNEVFLRKGSQISRPVNLQGYVNLRSFVTYGFPINKMKCNLNVNAGFNYTRTPGLINNNLNYSHSPSGNLGISLSSNISKNIDFTISSTTNMTYVSNSLQRNLNSNFINQTSRAKFYWDIWKGIVLTGDLTHQYFTGLSQGFNQNFFLWNMGLAKKFLKKREAEIKFSVFDILNQNNSISRNITDIYTEDMRTVVLNRYYMLTFTYNFRTFKKGNPPSENKPRK